MGRRQGTVEKMEIGEKKMAKWNSETEARDHIKQMVGEYYQ